MQTPDAIAAKKVAAILMHGTRDVYVDPFGNLCVDDVPQPTSTDVTVGTCVLLEFVGSPDVEPGTTAALSKKRSQFAPALKRVLAKMAGQELNLIGEFLAIRGHA